MDSSVGDLVEELVDVKRVTKVVSGGRILSFVVCVIVGDMNGYVGYAHDSAREVADARLKALNKAKNRLIKVPLHRGTVYCDASGVSDAARVCIRRVTPGTGIIAGGVLRVLFKLAGVRDIMAKSLGSSNTCSVLAATFIALGKILSPAEITAKLDARM